MNFMLKSEGPESLEGLNCTPPASSAFPPSLFTHEQLSNGYISLHLLTIVYMLAMIAVVCHEFFVPAIEKLTSVCDISANVAGAGMMATAASTPQLATAIIGVFVGHSDIGVGAVTGASFFNIFIIPAVCGLLVKPKLKLHWWPMFRDCMSYLIASVVLTICFIDSMIEWFEALILCLCYVGYLLMLYFDPRIERWAKKVAMPWCKARIFAPINALICRGRCPSWQFDDIDTTSLVGADFDQVRYRQDAESSFSSWCEDASTKTETSANNSAVINVTQEPKRAKDAQLSSAVESDAIQQNGTPALSVIGDQFAQNNVSQPPPQHTKDGHIEILREECLDEPEEKPLQPNVEYHSLLKLPSKWYQWIVYVIMFPAKIILLVCIPDFRRPGCHRHMFILTLIMSVIFIGFTSYLMVWMSSVLSDVLGAPPTVMGMTLLAAGGSLPDLLASAFATKDGYGEMAVANTIGSNLFDILVCLGMPWFVNYFVAGNVPLQLHGDLTLESLCLIASAIVAFIAVSLNKFQLDWKTSVGSVLLYIISIGSLSYYEWSKTLPMCEF